VVQGGAAFETQAPPEGQLLLSTLLERECVPDVLFLHRRKLGRERRYGAIDHIAIAPSGIFLIDAQRCPTKKVRVVKSGGLWTPVKERLTINGKDNSHLLEGCETQMAAVRQALGGHHLAVSVKVTPLLCFVDANLPAVLRTAARGVRVVSPNATVKMLRREGPLELEDRLSLQSRLDFMLPPA
jgi:hypothetical protein